MAAGESDKQVKLSFTVDTASVQRAKQAIGELIIEATKLANVLKHTSIGGGTIGGGGGGGGASLLGGGGLVGPDGRPLAGNTNLTAQQNPLQRITGAVTNDAQALKGVATSSADAIKSLTEAVRASALDQGRNIDSLQSKLNNLVNTYGKLGDVSSVGGGAGPTLYDAYGRPISGGGGGGGGGAGTPSAAVAAGGAGKAPPTFTDEAVKSAISLGAIKMGLNVGQQFAGMMGSGGSVWQSNLMAAQGKTWGGMYQGAYNQDIGTGYKSLFLGGGLTGGGFDKYNKVMESIKGAKTADEWQTMLGDMSGVLGMDTTKFRDAAFNEQRAAALRGQAMAAVAENAMQSTGLPMMTAINRFQGQIGTQIGLERQYGYGGGYWKNVNGKLTKSNKDELIDYKKYQADYDYAGIEVGYGDPLHERAIALTNRGVLQADDAAAAEQVRISGARSAQALIAGAIGAGGAWGGAGGLAGQAAIGGASGRFLGGVMGMGGLDAAAMGMGGLAAGTLGAAGVQTTGLGLLGAMQQGFGTTGGEGDLWNTREAQGGLQLMSGLLGGGIDQYQQAVNFANAGTAFGGGDMSRQQYLSTVFGKDPNLVADILSPNASASTKKWMAAHGITKEEVSEFVRKSGASLIGRAAAQETGADPGQRAIMAVQNEAGGDVGAYMKMHGIIKGTAAARDLAENLGAGGAETGISDDAGWAGFIKTTTGFGSDLNVGGRGRVKSASSEEALRAQAEVAKNDKETVDANMGIIKASSDVLAPAMTAFGGAVKELEANAEHLGDALEWVARKALKAFGMTSENVDEFIEASDKRRADEKAKPGIGTVGGKGGPNRLHNEK